MQKADILVVGAGAAGLMAAMHLTKAGKRVLVLEACDRIGGRIHTFAGNGFTQPVELGAEFVHGNLPVTLALLKEAGIKPQSAVGDMWRYQDGKFHKSDQFLLHYDLIIEKLNALKEDITLEEFLDTYFAEAKYKETSNQLRNFAASYDTADPARFSVFAMRDELQSEDDGHQYRPEGGYGSMIAYLEQKIMQHGGEIHLLTPTKELKWEHNNVTAVSADGRHFTAAKVIIALPLGVLQAGKSEQGAITFTPAIPQREQAIQQMGFGAIIKILLEFDNVFWQEQALQKGASADVKDMSYLFSSEVIPTWWTQTPNNVPLLTGWLGGPAAAKLKSMSNDEILDMALSSLSNIYTIPVAELKSMLKAYQIMNWLAHPYTRGSYSYATVHTDASRKLLSKPEQDTLYFTGEAFYEGPEMGTVEAALANGKAIAKLILEKLNS